MPRKSAAAATVDPAILAELQALRARNAELEAEIGAPLIGGIENRPKQAGTVTVACKIPQGLQLQLQHPMKRKMPIGRGGDNDYEHVEFMVKGGPVYNVFGPSVPAQVPDGYVLPPGIEGGYALTPGIPAAFWAEWLEQNKLAPYVVNGMIFAHDHNSAVSFAREHKNEKSGLEPISRDANADGSLKDRRVPKSMTGSVTRIATDADRMNSPERRPALAE